MIYLTGDTHADFKRFSSARFPDQKEMTKDDMVIILGDFGGVWNYTGESSQERWWLDWLNDKHFTTCFVDGNHENYTRLYSNEYPIIDFHGGKVHQLRDSIYHLMRGHIFDFEDKQFFVMGGAKSHDIQDGIFDMYKYKSAKLAIRALNRWQKQGKQFRVKDFSWWESEIPHEQELSFGRQKLDSVHYEVDYVLSHCLPTSVAAVGGWRESDPLTTYFDHLLQDGLKFYRWYCGHYHVERRIMGKFIIKYEDIERIL